MYQKRNFWTTNSVHRYQVLLARLVAQSWTKTGSWNNFQCSAWTRALHTWLLLQIHSQFSFRKPSKVSFAPHSHRHSQSLGHYRAPALTLTLTLTCTYNLTHSHRLSLTPTLAHGLELTLACSHTLAIAIAMTVALSSTLTPTITNTDTSTCTPPTDTYPHYPTLIHTIRHLSTLSDRP